MCIYERLGLSPALSRLYASVGLYFLGPVLMFICPGGARNGDFGKCLVRTCAARNIFKQKAPLNTSLYSFDRSF